MLSLVIHAALGALTVWLFYRFNGHLYRDEWPGARVTLLGGAYYAFAVGSVSVGWGFNGRYVMAYPAQASWMHFISMLFDNPAAGSAGQDMIVTNVFLFPLWTMIDGPRRGMRQPWIYFVISLFTSFGFSVGLYFAAQGRQLRWEAPEEGARRGG